MRGSTYYQTSLLAKEIFSEGSKKKERVNSFFPGYQKVSSFKTMETYRRVWNNFGLFVKHEFGIKDFEKCSAEHIESYMLQKIDIAPSKQYMEKISSALGKLEIALQLFSKKLNRVSVEYDFSIRKEVLNTMRKNGEVYDGYHNRIYSVPEHLIATLKNPEHQLAAKIQLASGARFEGIGLIKASQLKHNGIDSVTKKRVGLLETKEKGGKVGLIFLNTELYNELIEYLKIHKTFKVDYQQYAKCIRSACKYLCINPEGSHGFRWTFAQRRIREYQKYGYNYEAALQGVSIEMKHNRIDISEHYIG